MLSLPFQISLSSIFHYSSNCLCFSSFTFYLFSDQRNTDRCMLVQKVLLHRLSVSGGALVTVDMADEFSSCVELGLKLSKRLYYGKTTVSAPPLTRVMSRSPMDGHLPTAPMVYAVISEPEIVDNPDVPSYQPYVHGKCAPPALIPLHMHDVGMEIDCYLDTAFVTVSGAWHLHCVMASRNCDCRIAIPTGERGSVLGVEVDATERSYHTEWITLESKKDMEKAAKAGIGNFLKSSIYTLRVPEIRGGAFLTIKMQWSQKLLYRDGRFCLSIPFSFPSYVIPVRRKTSKTEKIFLRIKSGTRTEIMCQSVSHPLKELSSRKGNLIVSYEADVPAWSMRDFDFSYSVCSFDMLGDVLVKAPFLHDSDQREMFCFYLFPEQNMKVFKKDVIFVIDTSGSMRGSPLENVKDAVVVSLSQFNEQDTFNIMIFNEEVQLFSSSMELAMKETISNARNWIATHCSAKGGTNIMQALTQAIMLLSKTADSIPLVILITDGTVEDEREICNFVKGQFVNGRLLCPRLCTFGIGLHCNHHFLQMLAEIGRGHYDAAFETDQIGIRLQRLFITASSVVVANLTTKGVEALDSLELYPTYIPDLSSQTPLIISGRYDGSFPESIEVNGTLADLSNFSVKLRVQRTNDIPLDKVLAKRHIDFVTAQAWLSSNKELEEKVAKMSIRTGVPSEHTCLVSMLTEKEKKEPASFFMKQVSSKLNLQKMEEHDGQKFIFLGILGIGFGDLTATANNIPPGMKVTKADATELLVRATTNLCGQLADRFCCMCLIRAGTHMNDQCVIAWTQLCAALSCFECLGCCFELCDCDCDCLG